VTVRQYVRESERETERDGEERSIVCSKAHRQGTIWNDCSTVWIRIIYTVALHRETSVDSVSDAFHLN